MSTASSIFAVPCPTCADELVPVAPHEYQCSRCRVRYRVNVGYLEPLGPAFADGPS